VQRRRQVLFVVYLEKLRTEFFVFVIYLEKVTRKLLVV
jgi:hypothetical protein